MKKRINIISMGRRLTVVVGLHKVNRPVVVERVYPISMRRGVSRLGRSYSRGFSSINFRNT